MRYVTILICAALLVSGCLGGPAGSGDGTPTHAVTPGPTERPDSATAPETASTAETTSGPPEPTDRPFADCAENVPATVNPDRETVTPSPLPERPAELTGQTATEFARDYENAYQRNLGLTADTTTYEVSIHESSTRRVDGGFVVNISARYWYNERPVRTGTKTATPVHADGPLYRVLYLVTDEGVRRASSLDSYPTNPWTGTVVECWG